MAHPRYVPTFAGMDHGRVVITGAASVGTAMGNNRDPAGTTAEAKSTPLTINIAAACARKSLLEKLPRVASISDMLTYLFHQAPGQQGCVLSSRRVGRDPDLAQCADGSEPAIDGRVGNDHQGTILGHPGHQAPASSRTTSRKITNSCACFAAMALHLGSR